MYYSDQEKCDQDTQPGWDGSGVACSGCGTTDYFNSDIDGDPMCGDCIRGRNRYRNDDDY